MKILHLIKTSVGGTWAYRQMRELVRLGVEVHVALPPGGALIASYQAAGVIVHPLNLDFPPRQPGRWALMFHGLRGLVSGLKPDIIHSHNVSTTLTMRLALGKRHPVPRIFQVPAPLHLEHLFFRWAEILTAGPRDYWIGSCRLTCDIYRRSGIAGDKVFLSYYGTDVDSFRSQPTGQLRRELGLSPDTMIIGMVAYMYAPKRYLGRWRGHKGHEDLIDALAICLDRGHDLLGVFIGGAWNGALEYEARVRDYASRRCGERAIFLGTRGDLNDLYPDIDVAVHPSHSENVGGAVDSLLSGVPTVAARTGGLPDVIIPGQTGWLVTPRAPAELADTLIEVLGNPGQARALAAHGRQIVRQSFDVRRTAQEVRDIYLGILDSPG
jgi:glycosyltransferase involved in cell wall biosynthesis